jgi:Ran GTPase-activating protein (RanGAP) involved in mRNA processing and transport
MRKIAVSMSDILAGKLEMVCMVDEITQMQVMRDALKEYFEGLDMKWYKQEFDELEVSPKDIDKFESESDGDKESDAETEEEEVEDEEEEEEEKE